MKWMDFYDQLESDSASDVSSLRLASDYLDSTLTPLLDWAITNSASSVMDAAISSVGLIGTILPTDVLADWIEMYVDWG